MKNWLGTWPLNMFELVKFSLKEFAACTSRLENDYQDTSFLILFLHSSNNDKREPALWRLAKYSCLFVMARGRWHSRRKSSTPPPPHLYLISSFLTTSPPFNFLPFSNWTRHTIETLELVTKAPLSLPTQFQCSKTPIEHWPNLHKVFINLIFKIKQHQLYAQNTKKSKNKIQQNPPFLHQHP